MVAYMVHGFIDRWMNGSMDGCINQWTGWMHEWMKGNTYGGWVRGRFEVGTN